VFKSPSDATWGKQELPTKDEKVGLEYGLCLQGQIFAPAISALTSKDGGNAARLPGAIAATTSLWIM
jgi:hypothetical protein